MLDQSEAEQGPTSVTPGDSHGITSAHGRASAVLLSVGLAWSLYCSAQPAAPSTLPDEERCGSSVRWPEAMPQPPGELSQRETAAVKGIWDRGPNFACTALVVTWSCGSGCAGGVIIDSDSQVWYRLPFVVHRDLGQETPLLQYTAEDITLTVNGWLNEEELGSFQYRWTGRELLPVNSADR